MVPATWSRMSSRSEMGILTCLHEDLVIPLLPCALHASTLLFWVLRHILAKAGTSWIFLPGTSWILSVCTFEERFLAGSFSSMEWLERYLALKAPTSAPNEATQRFEQP